MEDRFEDVPQELDELDRVGRIKLKSYYEFYQEILYYNSQINFLSTLN